MLEDLRALTETVYEGGWPAITCPTCFKGQLQIEGDVRYRESRDSTDNHSAYPDEWEPEWQHGVFSGLLRCSFKSCGEWVAIGGRWALEQVPTEEIYNNFEKVMTLQWANPPLRFFAVPSATPEVVRSSTDAAAALTWTDPDAAANRLREAVERLLDHRKIRKTRVTAKGKKHRQVLSERIDDLATQPKYSVVSGLFHALRVRGNVGTHGSGLAPEHVLDMAAVLELALRLLYDTKDVKTVQLAKSIIKKKGKA